jgi:uncharacterized hydrophobic protein (TIGR00271 family)
MSESTTAPLPEHPFAPRRWDRVPLYRWWRKSVVVSVDQEQVIARILQESGSSPHYLFMTMMSAGIAVLGLLLSSPAVVIGAMLISPLMSPILGLGFSLAVFDFKEMRRSMSALAIGAGCALLFTAVIVLASPLKAPTAEILSRTRPNLFDLLVALFAALAGTFAIIRGRGETIVGVAIATALMPPLAVVGFGVATWNMPIMGGALALFVTNFVTIALAAMVMARFYGFGHYLSTQQSWMQTIVLLLIFVAMAVPLGFSLSRIASEAVTVSQVRSFLSDRFGTAARINQLEVDFDRVPLAIRTVVMAPPSRAEGSSLLQSELSTRLGRPVALQIDRVLVEPGTGSVEAQRAALRQSSAAAEIETRIAGTVANLVGLAAGVSPDSVTIDREHRRATAVAATLPGGAGLAVYAALEQRAAASVQDWNIAIIPPLAPLPLVRFVDGADALDAEARDAVLLSAWAAKRWNSPQLSVPALPADDIENPSLAQRRALTIAALLREQGIAPIPAPASGASFRLTTGVFPKAQ